MLDLEGTKNERSIVIILSYVIGFVSAFIWLGVTDSGTDPSKHKIISRDVPPVQDHSPIATPAQTQTANGTSVKYEHGVLQLLHGNRERMLSLASSNVNPEEVPLIKSATGQGVHEDISVFKVSEDGMYVFFCENYGGASCNAFIYDIANDLIRPVRQNGTVAALPVAVAKQMRWESGRIMVGDHTSVSAAEPWLVAQQ